MWDKSDRHGEYTLNGKRFLLVPAGYPERLISYPVMNSVINWFPHEEEIKSWYDNVYTDSNMVYSTLAIDLSITVDYDFLKKYIIVEDGSGNSFAYYNNRLYYLNSTSDKNVYYMIYYNIDSIAKSDVINSRMVVTLNDDGNTIEISEINKDGSGKSNISTVKVG